MTGSRLYIHTAFMIALPVLVAYFGISTAGAVALVLLALVWRWAISLSGVLAPVKAPELELETIPISHFAEKVRWCLDRLGVVYREKQVAGIYGVVFTGRTVPRLFIRTGLVRSSIGNSPEILRYLWGTYGSTLGEKAAFLEPTPERIEMEKRIDRYGAHLQVWIYYHLLGHKDLALRAWGQHSSSVPAWQRAMLPLMFPVFRTFISYAFRTSEEHYRKVLGHIEGLLDDVESRLDDGRRSILGGDNSDFLDLSFAAISALWLQPAQFAAGRAEAVRIGEEHYPPQMSADIERWKDSYPLVTALVERLYREER